MPNPINDTITITITRGRWSISRSMDLDALDVGARIERNETLSDLYDECRFIFESSSHGLSPELLAALSSNPVEQSKPLDNSPPLV